MMGKKKQPIGMTLHKSLIWNWQSYLHSAIGVAHL